MWKSKFRFHIPTLPHFQISKYSVALELHVFLPQVQAD